MLDDIHVKYLRYHKKDLGLLGFVILKLTSLANLATLTEQSFLLIFCINESFAGSKPKLNLVGFKQVAIRPSFE